MSIRLKFIVLLGAILISSCTKKTQVVEEGYVPWGNHLLWEIEHSENKSTSYVFGTMHLIPEADYFEPSGFQEAIAEAQTLVMEMDMQKIMDSGMGQMMGLLDKLMLPDGQTLKDLYSPEEYEKVSSAITEKMGFPMMMAERIKPSFLSMMLEIDFSSMGSGMEDIKSYEMELVDLANDQGMTTYGLETMAEQIGIFDAIPLKEQAQMLLAQLDKEDTSEESLEELVTAYRSQNIESMAKILDKDENMKRYNEQFIDQRNKNWIPKIKEQTKLNSCFIGVGAAHLGGENGVLNLLRQEGFKVKPVE